MTSFHTKVSLRGFHFEDSHLTFTLDAAITAADVGKAVSMSATANTVQLAGVDEEIVGRLETVENRKVEGQLIGTIALRFSNELPIAAGEVINPGDTVVGAGGGTVKAALAKNHAANFVAEVGDGKAIVVKV